MKYVLAAAVVLAAVAIAEVNETARVVLLTLFAVLVVSLVVTGRRSGRST